MDVAHRILEVPITTQMLGIFFTALVIFFIIISSIFVYHWRYYGVEGNHRVFAKSLYFVIGIGLILAMLVSLVIFNQH